jgi:hypothetical protein
MKTPIIAMCLAAVIALALVPTSAAYPNEYARATTVGDHYIYVYMHGLAFYQETNGLDNTSPCSVVEGPPVAHIPLTGVQTPTLGKSGLQVKACGLVAADTRLFDTDMLL